MRILTIDPVAGGNPAEPAREIFSDPLKRQRRLHTMTWSTPAYQDLRLGFEINLYINNR